MNKNVYKEEAMVAMWTLALSSVAPRRGRSRRQLGYAVHIHHVPTAEFPTRMWLFFVVIPWTVYRELCDMHILWFIVNSLGMKICMGCVKVLQCFICQTLNVWGVLLDWGRGFPEAIPPRFWRTAPHSAFWTSWYYITSQILFIWFPKSGVGGFV